MTHYQTYIKKLETLTKRLQTLEQFRKEDPMAHFVFQVARSFFNRKMDTYAIDWLLSKGGKLTSAYAYLSVKANEYDGIAKLAAITCKSVKDAVVLGLKGGEVGIMEARARASQEMIEAEVDIILKEQKADNYQTTSRAASTMVMFIQSILKSRERERSQTPLAES